SPFYNKKTLKSVTIGNSVTSIGNYAFSLCDSLTSIYLLSETPPTVSSNNFTNKQYLNMIVYVPKGTLATYQAADTWKNFWDIQEFDVTAIENIEDVTPAFEITSSGIQFTAADGEAIAIYTANGALVEKIDNYAGEEIALDKGVYIVRVGNKIMKVKL
ncbi:MAG: leucine-rich repeat protein, partial [Bacteroidaceae bacterium]|nr:leucine-rich repeat protein [Bacteroidaceae bacterium]